MNTKSRNAPKQEDADGEVLQARYLSLSQLASNFQKLKEQMIPEVGKPITCFLNRAGRYIRDRASITPSSADMD